MAKIYTTNNLMDTSFTHTVMVNMQEAFCDLRHDEGLSPMRATLITNNFELILRNGRIEFDSHDVERSQIKLTMEVDNFAEMFDMCGTPLERIYDSYSYCLPSANIGRYVPIPPSFEVNIYVGSSTPIEMYLDPITLKWTVSPPYNTYYELLEFVEEKCYGTRALHVREQVVIDTSDDDLEYPGLPLHQTQLCPQLELMALGDTPALDSQESLDADGRLTLLSMV